MIEMGYLLLTLNIIGERANQLRFFSVCNIVSVILLLFMAAGSFMSLSSKQRKNIVVDNGMNRLLLGISLSAVNPMQIPFWMGWAILLASRLHASGVFSGNIIFTLSAGIGTFLALILFIILGKKLSELMDRKKKMISIILGCLFTALAAFQVLRLLQLP